MGLPLIATCDLRLCVPRVPNFKAMIAAKKKLIKIIEMIDIIKASFDFECKGIEEYTMAEKHGVKIDSAMLKEIIKISL